MTDFSLIIISIIQAHNISTTGGRGGVQSWQSGYRARVGEVSLPLLFIIIIVTMYIYLTEVAQCTLLELYIHIRLRHSHIATKAR